ncbi:tetraspanin-7-like [Coccinella septempunctata]|uniref:tetraspanin-7-like n=1 Tax=Coccinella septempunctata TaxID=41139 RepID=UPI001D0711E6|nr:tetraspanin-7-like [Coccinella septempunctata]XP_044752331.1 tetraspanin-7-like [Coccinella septempunctata]
MTLRFQTIATMACMKSFLMAFNFIFWLSGIIILIIGIWMKVDLHKYTEMSTKFSNIIPYVLIAIGAFIFLIGTFACCCTLKGQPGLLYIYGGILAAIFVLELGCSFSVYTYRADLMEGLDEGITNAMNNYYNETANISDDFDEMQLTLKCCGSHNASDWLNINPSKIPASCCIRENCDVYDETQIFQEGCYEKIINFLKTNIGGIGLVAMVVAIFPLVGLILSCSLARLLNKHKYEQMS